MMKGINIQRPVFKNILATTSENVQRSRQGNCILELKREFRVSSELTELFFGKPFHQGSITYINQHWSTTTLQVQEGHDTPTGDRRTMGPCPWRTGCRMACRRKMVATTAVPDHCIFYLYRFCSFLYPISSFPYERSTFLYTPPKFSLPTLLYRARSAFFTPPLHTPFRAV